VTLNDHFEDIEAAVTNADAHFLRIGSDPWEDLQSFRTCIAPRIRS